MLNLFNLLAQFSLSDACSIAQKHKDNKLALLIAQAASGNLGNRLLLRQQLSDWDRMEVNMHRTNVVNTRVGADYDCNRNRL